MLARARAETVVGLLLNAVEMVMALGILKAGAAYCRSIRLPSERLRSSGGRRCGVLVTQRRCCSAGLLPRRPRGAAHSADTDWAAMR